MEPGVAAEAAPALDAEKQAAKDAKAAAKKAEKEAKKLKAQQKKEVASAKVTTGDSSKKAIAKAEAKAKAEAEAAQVETLINAVRATPAGEKKDVGLEAPKGYSPKYALELVHLHLLLRSHLLPVADTLGTLMPPRLPH